MGSRTVEKAEAYSIMAKIVYNVKITGKIEIDTDTLEDHELNHDHPYSKDKPVFDIARYLKLITSTIEQSHRRWVYTTGYAVERKQIYNKRGIPTSEPVGEGCCG